MNQILSTALSESYTRIVEHLDEKGRRLWCANEAIRIGHGGIALVARATKMSRTTITEGKKEIMGKKTVSQGRVRRSGGGRGTLISKDPTLLTDLENLVESATRGDPENPLLWCSKSIYKIAAVLNKEKKRISPMTVSRELRTLGYTLQANSKTLKEGADNPDRDLQFQHINTTIKYFQSQYIPVISIDCKKKENIGNFKNNGREYHKKGESEKVLDHDFMNLEKGKVAPYGILDLTKNIGWVNVGMSADTAPFAVNSIRTWWKEMGQPLYPEARELFMMADCGGSNSYRSRLWKIELQKLATELNMTIHVSHFPPGTSKWNKIEHKLFSFITKNWRNTPLRDHATVIKLISNTTTKAGLTVMAQLDETHYETGIKVSDEDFAHIALVKNDFHGEWNYKILPKND